MRKSEIPLSEICPISGDWGELGMPNLAGISLMSLTAKCQVYNFYRFRVI